MIRAFSLFSRLAAFFSDNNFQKFPIIGSNNNYWIKLSSIIGNYCPRKQAAYGEKKNKIILCGYIII